MGRDCPKVYGDKPQQHTIAQHPRYVAAASLRQCDDRRSHEDHPSAAVHRCAVQSIAGWVRRAHRPPRSFQVPLQSLFVCPLALPTYPVEFRFSGSPRRSRFRLARYEDAISQMRSKVRPREEYEAGPRPETDQTIQLHL